MTTQTPHLLHIDSSVLGERSVSRSLTRRAVDGWLAAHPGGTIAYRDLALDPPPHLDPEAAAARFIPAEHHSAGQAAGYTLSQELIGEVLAADAVVLGVPLYNYGPPSTVKAWIDHLLFQGLSVTPDMSEGLLGGRRFIVLGSRGGGYREGAPHFGWDHAEPWLPHILSAVGLDAEVIVAELTMADANPALAHLRPLAEESLTAAQAAIDELWVAAVV